jgi:hypothetical protein
MSEDTEIPELPLTEDGPTEEVDIEITEEDLGESLVDYQDDESEEEVFEEEPEEQAVEEEPEEEEEEEAPKRKRSPDRRIAELARKAADADRRAQELEARLQQAEQQRQQSDMAMMTHYEQRLHGRAEEVKRQLIDAHSIGDSERIVDLQGEFYKLQSDLNSIDSWKAQQELNAPQPKRVAEEQARQPEGQPQPALEPRTANWIQKNTWFQPNSGDFDPEMHEEATIYARRIERRYRSEGRDNEIGGVDYFTEIDRHMQNEFPDAFSERSTPSKKVPPMSRESNVAPVQRSGNPGQPAKNTKSIRLTADQRRMAHQLAQSGAIRNAKGGRMTDMEAEKYYAVHMMKQNKGA